MFMLKWARHSSNSARGSANTEWGLSGSSVLSSVNLIGFDNPKEMSVIPNSQPYWTFCQCPGSSLIHRPTRETSGPLA